MDLGSINYVPILKSKRAELCALKDLSPNHKSRLLPLLEVVLAVPRASTNIKTVAAKEAAAIKLFIGNRADGGEKDNIIPKVLESWGHLPIIIDLTLIYDARAKLAGLKAITAACRGNASPAIAVNMSDTDQYKQALSESIKTDIRMVCLRLTEPDLKDINRLNEQIKELLSRLGIKPEATILLIDLKDQNDRQKYRQTTIASQMIVHLKQWATVVVASGSFPEDLAHLEAPGSHLEKRLDWSNWLSCRGLQMQRRPLFSDYTIRHPGYRFDWQFYQPSSSLKYTLEDDWWIIRGTKGHMEQYLAGAQIIADNDRFKGPDYSIGDQLIQEKADYYKSALRKMRDDPNHELKLKTGNAEIWIRTGINHHLTLTTNQIMDSGDHKRPA